MQKFWDKKSDKKTKIKKLSNWIKSFFYQICKSKVFNYFAYCNKNVRIKFASRVDKKNYNI